MLSPDSQQGRCDLGPDRHAAAMKQDTLVAVRDPEQVADVAAAHALYVPHHDLSLRRRQPLDRRHGEAGQPVRVEALLY